MTSENQQRYTPDKEYNKYFYESVLNGRNKIEKYLKNNEKWQKISSISMMCNYRNWKDLYLCLGYGMDNTFI